MEKHFSIFLTSPIKLLFAEIIQLKIYSKIQLNKRKIKREEWRHKEKKCALSSSTPHPNST